jgi:UDP-N-acetyl-2-amino-2-deoxyglucuronate dehydrogenase
MAVLPATDFLDEPAPGWRVRHAPAPPRAAAVAGALSAAPAAPLRVAVLGTGMASAPHFAGLAALAAGPTPEVEVAWVWGRDVVRLKAATTRVDWPADARVSTDLDEVLADASLHAVLVLTPPHTHLELAEHAARAGKHVLVEKPLEVNLARATALVAACEMHGVRLAVMLQHRRREASMALQQLVERGQLGRPISASAQVRWWRPQSYYDVPGRGTLARDGGGVLMTQAIHTLDLLLQYTGEPVQAHAFALTSPLHRMECEDTAVAILRFPGGAVATVEATTAAPPGYPECITLNGTLGTATLQAGVLVVVMADGRRIEVGEAQGGGGADPMAFDHCAHQSLLHDFVRSIRDAREPAVSGRSALAVQRLIDTLMVSAPGAPQARSEGL